ncbi:MAG: hypothetical protein WCC12_03495, partial [Anaerolineales bacterium]
TISVILGMLLLASCNGWVIRPGPFNPPTPFLPPSRTPSIFTPTPLVIGVASATPTPQIATATGFILPTLTTVPTSVPSDTPAVTQTSSPIGPSLSVEILGCNTSIDVTHSMGEVTNAFVVLRNTGGVDLANVTATLKARDEGREHPDKTKQLPTLPVGYKVTLKLTVDSTYQEETPIQVEVAADGGLFQRVGSASCQDIGLFGPNPNGLNTPIPDNP